MVGKLAEVKHCKAQQMLRGTECCSGWSSSLRDPAGHQGQRNREANEIVDETSVSPRRLQEKAEAGYVAMQRCEMDIICASITSVSPRRLHEKAEAGHVAMQRREMKKRGWRRSDPVLSCSRWSWRCTDSLWGCSSQLRRLMGL